MRKIVVLILVLFLLAAGSPVSQAQGGRRNLPPINRLPTGSWTYLTPGGATGCADGSPYHFIVYPGATDRVMIYFQGGGACWDTNTCINLQVYDRDVAAEVATQPAPPPERSGGLLNIKNPDNPFYGVTVLYVPYCSGDFHTGNNWVAYPTTPGNVVGVSHRGATNAGAALNWLFNNIRAPQSVFMTGCSAGGPAAAFHAPSVLRQYPNARVSVFGDSAGGYQGNLNHAFYSWGTVGALSPYVNAFRDQAVDTLTFETFYTAVGQAYPAARLAQFNTTNDEIQQFYLALLATDPNRYEGILLGNLITIHSQIANFRSFTVRGDWHCITPREEFYTLEVDGVRLRDWVAALAAGGEVWNVFPEGFNLWFDPPQ